MKKLTSNEIREKFLAYFEKNNHLKIKASSLLPQNDPTLLFINSGMAPLKSYFLGKDKPPAPRLCNFQPCIRTKDIDDVGDRHHLTIFEMMGSWSIGDYYKEEACKLAYNLLVLEFGFDPEKLYMTVYGGSEGSGIPADTASIEAWRKCGVPEDHIIVLGDDNFWGPAGETGPCGPCTEVFYDTGDQHGPAYYPGGEFDDKGRYIEIWNAGVFMELNKKKDGTFVPLPLKSVDTGSGLERMAMVMNGHDSVYETDLMEPLMALSAKLLGSDRDVCKLRMLTDHIRAAVMIISEGVAPSNEGQGYIPRRLIRKSIASLVNAKAEKIDFTEMINKVIELLVNYYPHLKSSREMILYNFKNEVDEFVPVIKNGLELIEKELKENPSSKKLFSGKVAFELMTTYGLPLEIIHADLDEREIILNLEEYEKCYENHRRTSRVVKKISTDPSKEELEDLVRDISKTDFRGYEHIEASGSVLALISGGEKKESVSKGEKFFLISDKTPFYGESGGQAGDSGLIKNSSCLVKVEDTLKIKDIILHVGVLESGVLNVGDELTFSVDSHLRSNVKKNHSTTHLLHSALHKVIGNHATQKGSQVREDRLRFDFQHNKAVNYDELREIEKIVNGWIRENTLCQIGVVQYEEALSMGALALFGEKYSEKVRVVSFDQKSVELCGGTHVERTGDIGLFVILSEASVAKGVRRIEATTGEHAIKYIQDQNLYLKKVGGALGGRAEELEGKVKDLRKKLSEKRKETAHISASNIKYLKEISFDLNGNSFFFGQMDIEAAQVKAIGDEMINKAEKKIVCLVSSDEKSNKFFVWVQKELSQKIKAGALLQKMLLPVSGKGGGKPHFAQGGVSQSVDLNQVFEYVEHQLSKDWP